MGQAAQASGSASASVLSRVQLGGLSEDPESISFLSHSNPSLLFVKKKRERSATDALPLRGTAESCQGSVDDDLQSDEV